MNTSSKNYTKIKIYRMRLHATNINEAKEKRHMVKKNV